MFNIRRTVLHITHNLLGYAHDRRQAFTQQYCRILAFACVGTDWHSDLYDQDLTQYQVRMQAET